MLRIPSFSRVLAAGVLVVSALALGLSPVGASSVAPAVAPSATFTYDAGNGTVDLTYSDFTSPFLVFFPAETTCPDPAGGPLTDEYDYSVGPGLPSSPMTISVNTAVSPSGTLPSGSYSLCLYDVAAPGELYLEADGGTNDIDGPTTASMVDNGNGSLTVTYANVTVGRNVTVFLLTGTETCPPEPDSTATGFAFQAGFNIGESPFVIGVGTPGIPLPLVGFTTSPVPAGSYLACLFYYSGDTYGLQQSLPMSIAVPPPAPEPVTPAFTG